MIIFSLFIFVFLTLIYLSSIILSFLYRDFIIFSFLFFMQPLFLIVTFIATFDIHFAFFKLECLIDIYSIIIKTIYIRNTSRRSISVLIIIVLVFRVFRITDVCFKYLRYTARRLYYLITFIDLNLFLLILIRIIILVI
jgi:hypothetical protein